MREGAATDQEESGGCQRERGRPSSALLSKSLKVEDGLLTLRIGVPVAEEGVPGGEAAGGGGGVAPLVDGGERRSQQDSSRSPPPHQNAAGGEDDASVLDTPLQDKVEMRGLSLCG